MKNINKKQETRNLTKQYNRMIADLASLNGCYGIEQRIEFKRRLEETIKKERSVL